MRGKRQGFAILVILQSISSSRPLNVYWTIIRSAQYWKNESTVFFSGSLLWKNLTLRFYEIVTYEPQENLKVY